MGPRSAWTSDESLRCKNFHWRLQIATVRFVLTTFRYSATLGHLPPRCNPSVQSPDTCDGSAFEKCGRFVGATAIEQSNHSCDSKQCEKLLWDEVSYRNFQVPVVSIRLSSATRQLRYCELSNNTLAISHVWSHGQGGRPETGFNECLHSRYAEVARSMACDSYWMDTPCIPSESSLRTKAIANINHIFTMSKATLVCDRDFLAFDTSSLEFGHANGHTLQTCEALLVCLLVSDWNGRGWTFLEAVRGKQALYLLCRKHHAVALSRLLTYVSAHGKPELVNLFLSADHLLRIPSCLFSKHVGTGLGLRMILLNSVEEAGLVLSRRPRVSAQVIWSLLAADAGTNSVGQATLLDRGNRLASRAVTDTAHKSAEDLWKHQHSVSTGYLVSSAPRIQGLRGMGWAPCSPVPGQILTRQGLRKYHPYDGLAYQNGFIKKSGLVAEWFTCLLPGKSNPDGHYEDHPDSRPREEGDVSERSHDLDPFMLLFPRQPDLRLNGLYRLGMLDRLYLLLAEFGITRASRTTMTELHNIADDHLAGYHWGMLLRPAAAYPGVHPGQDLTYYFVDCGVYEDNARAPLVVVCGSNDGESWTWKSVHFWNPTVALPVFQLRKVLLI